MSAGDSFSDRNSWLEYFGLDPRKDSFQEVAAEREENLLDRYFTRFPFFDDMYIPQTTFLFLKRGTGKSANRIMLQKHVQEYSPEPILVVPCTSYIELIDKSEVTLRDHVDLIMTEAVCTLYRFLPRMNLNNISVIERLIPFLRHYSKPFSDHKITVGGELFKGLCIDLFKKCHLPHTEKKLEELITNSVDFSAIHPIEIVKQFGKIVEASGFKHIFVFIDGIDDDNVGGNFQKAAKMLNPLLITTSLLQLSPFTFKFFLPLEIYFYLLQENLVRFDKLKVLSYEPERLWTQEQLKRLLEKRIEAFAIDHNMDNVPVDGELKSLSWLFEDELRHIVESEIIELAGASPRRLVYLVREIITQHTMLPPIKPYISKQTYENAKEIFQGKKTSN